MAIIWKLKPLLAKHGITMYRLIAQTGVAPSSIYGINSGTINASSRTVDRVLTGLQQLTGETFQIQDLMEWQPDTARADDG